MTPASELKMHELTVRAGLKGVFPVMPGKITLVTFQQVKKYFGGMLNRPRLAIYCTCVFLAAQQDHH